MLLFVRFILLFVRSRQLSCFLSTNIVKHCIGANFIVYFNISLTQYNRILSYFLQVIENRLFKALFIHEWYQSMDLHIKWLKSNKNGVVVGCRVVVCMRVVDSVPHRGPVGSIGPLTDHQGPQAQVLRQYSPIEVLFFFFFRAKRALYIYYIYNLICIYTQL